MAEQKTPWLDFSIRCSVGSLHFAAEAKLRGSQAVLVGPSGAGKTTLLRILAGLLRPGNGRGHAAEGTITLAGRTVWKSEIGRWLPPLARGCGMVMQRASLFPGLSVRDNIAFGLRDQSRAERERRIEEMSTLFRVQPLLTRKPSQLSGGEQQRVALARTLAPRPHVLLLDEPFGGLNLALKDAILADLDLWLTATNTPALYVTHDVAEGWRLGHQPGAEVLRIEAGRIVAQGPAASVLAEERSLLLRALD